MKIVMISDTHNHDMMAMNLPCGDLLVHAGDLTMSGTDLEVEDVMAELGEVANRYTYGAILVAGNHDFLFQLFPDEARKLVPGNLIYLEDSGVMIGGVSFWGSPISPKFNNWAFNKARGKKIREHWEKIPSGVDVLITHTPANGILDSVNKYGCEDLREEIFTRVKPKVHVCGHVRETIRDTIKRPDWTTECADQVIEEELDRWWYIPMDRTDEKDGEL